MDLIMAEKKRGRKKTHVSGLFLETKNEFTKGPRVACIFCSKEVPQNGSKMTEHLKKCLLCPESVKQSYLRFKTGDVDEVTELIEEAQQECRNTMGKDEQILDSGRICRT